MHHLLYGLTSQPGVEIPAHADLSHILTTAGNAPAFHALDHTYIVTMARLGYADVPEWLGRDRVKIIDDVAGSLSAVSPLVAIARWNLIILSLRVRCRARSRVAGAIRRGRS